jgi:hypothetical protein
MHLLRFDEVTDVDIIKNNCICTFWDGLGERCVCMWVCLYVMCVCTVCMYCILIVQLFLLLTDKLFF